MQKHKCTLCGREGTRGFMVVGINGRLDTQYTVCTNDTACATRQMKNERKGRAA